MLQISELVRVARTLDADGSSRLAQLAAQHWGCDRVQFVRSSANHVFFCDGPSGRAVLRLRPGVDGTLKHAWRIADLAARVAAAGGPVAATCASRDGALAVEIAVGRKRYVASAFARVEGRVLDADAVTREQAAAWGRGLARLHEHSTRLDPPPSLPRWSAVAEGSLRRLPTDRAVFGVVHGDPELDNVVWVDERTPIFVDLDDAAWSWFAADVCFALRDFAPLAGAPDTASQPVASFLAGYREIRSLGEEELTWLPLFGRAHALVTLGRLQRTLAEPSDPDWPDWATALRRRVEEVDARLRSALAS